jgi:hypothetical protein
MNDDEIYDEIAALTAQFLRETGNDEEAALQKMFAYTKDKPEYIRAAARRGFAHIAMRLRELQQH